jgi:hypothetical protein
LNLYTIPIDLNNIVKTLFKSVGEKANGITMAIATDKTLSAFCPLWSRGNHIKTAR